MKLNSHSRYTLVAIKLHALAMLNLISHSYPFINHYISFGSLFKLPNIASQRSKVQTKTGIKNSIFKTLRFSKEGRKPDEPNFCIFCFTVCAHVNDCSTFEVWLGCSGYAIPSLLFFNIQFNSSLIETVGCSKEVRLLLFNIDDE